MALDLPLPEKVFGHPWLLMANDKMSKSKGNVLYADDLVEKFGVDTVRYYLLHEIPFAQDGNITNELLINKHNSDLANILGNLVNRTITMALKYFDGNITYKGISKEIDSEFISKINNLDKKIEAHMDKLQVSNAISEIFEVLRSSNKYIDDTTPWILAKDQEESERLETILYNLLESIRICGLELSPYLPDTSTSILNQLNITDKDFVFKKNNKYLVKEPSILFERIDTKNL